MNRLVHIKGLHNFVPNQHLDFVLYNGTDYKTIPYKIIQKNNGYCFLLYEKDIDKNAIIFSLLHIDNKEDYCRQFSKLDGGNFPEHSSLENLKKTILSFFELNRHIAIPSKYKVGDKVIVGKRDGHMDDYPCSFVDSIVTPGKVLTIKAIESNNQYTHKYFEEPYHYLVEEDTYIWSSSMFSGLAKEQTPSSKLQITYIYEVNSEQWNVHFSDNDTISLSKKVGFLKNHNNVFSKLTSYTNLSQLLNGELTCVRDLTGYEPYINKEENIWVFIDHLKYKFGTEECKKTINPEFYKFLKNPPKREITQVSQQKTQGNAYQFQRRKGTVRAGDVPEGNRICGKRSKASVSSRPLSYRKGVGY